MDNFLKKLARFSIKHPFWGNFEAYYWRIIVLTIVASIVCKYSIDFSTWSMRENTIFVATVVIIFAIFFTTALFLPLLVNGVKKNLPEVVIPNVDDIFYNNPQHRPIIGRLIRIAGDDDDANLLRQWIFFFNQKKEAEEKMASFEMQFLSKG
jgi:hypothetical protein